ncbi:hypothetical protein [Methylobacterium sp. J-077]|uniref:hypothetical protein n=1 Tax=Methylobacterium sp. J-077 TaxID=2836656 RepID=UPI001FB981E7|nr:hypothetical protein [Methylobacterium sp. J-077]MCJ2124064.1 hypothetical protein [Methylobacterium sp. J-077]
MLDNIALALGMPTSAFSDPVVLGAMSANVELNRLWEAMDCDASRQAVLNVARVLAAAQTT